MIAIIESFCNYMDFNFWQVYGEAIERMDGIMWIIRIIRAFLDYIDYCDDYMDYMLTRNKTPRGNSNRLAFFNSSIQF